MKRDDYIWVYFDTFINRAVFLEAVLKIDSSLKINHQLAQIRVAVYK